MPISREVHLITRPSGMPQPSEFEIVETNRRERGRSAELVAVSAAVYAPWML